MIARTRRVRLIQLAVIAGVLLAFNAAFYPWAISLTGGPTLVGEWQGEVASPAGERRIVRFVVSQLDTSATSGCQSCPRINAMARICDDRGTVNDFEAWGNPLNWRGTAFSMKTRKTDDRPAAVTFGGFDGEWSGDALRLTTTLRSDVGHPLPDSPASITIVMRRGSESGFRDACEQLKRQSVRSLPRAASRRAS